jgi:hypothetical protein
MLEPLPVRVLVEFHASPSLGSACPSNRASERDDVLAAGIRDIIRSARTFAELEHHQAEADLAMLALGVAVEPLIERLRERVHLAMVLVLDRRVAETIALGSCDRLPFACELDALRIVRPAGGGDDGLHVALGAGDDVVADPLRRIGQRGLAALRQPIAAGHIDVDAVRIGRVRWLRRLIATIDPVNVDHRSICSS